MAEHAAEYEWRGEGDEAEVILYAPDDSAFGRAMPAARLPGVQSPVHAAASSEGFGWAVASATHAAPDLLSTPTRNLLLVAASTRSSTVEPQELTNRLLRDLPEAGSRIPHLNVAGVGRICEAGGRAAAEDGLIEEEDLRFLDPRPGDADALGGRALAAGPSEWETGVVPDLRVVSGVLDEDGAESLGLKVGAVVLIVRVGAGELGRLALGAHRERILRLAWTGDFGAEPDPASVPADTGEADDLVVALHAAANFADSRAARAVWTLRRVLGELAGGLEVRAAWTTGGIEERDGLLVHRKDLASIEGGEALVSGRYAAAGEGKMLASAPPFGISEEGGRWAWEEAGLLERWAELGLPGG